MGLNVGGSKEISSISQSQTKEPKLDAFEKKYGFQNMTNGKPIFSGKEAQVKAFFYRDKVKAMTKEEKIAHQQEIKELFGSSVQPKTSLQKVSEQVKMTKTTKSEKAWSDKAFGALSILGKIAGVAGAGGGGALVGAGVGALVGALLGAPFAGVGAAPGAAAGAILGGFVGGVGGSLLGGAIATGVIPIPKLGFLLAPLSFMS